MNTNPLISIIIPVFNREELVKDTLDSVLAQTYQAWECIVVDDGSTDDTWQVLEEYSQKDVRIKIFNRNREPKGAPTCRNIGAELSKGEYLIFWDSDDIMAPWCVEERLSFMNKNPELDFGLFQLLNISANNEYSLRCYIGEDDYLKRFLSFENAWGTLAVIWRKSFFKVLGGWNEKAKIWQDGEIHIRALLKKPNYSWGSNVPSGIIRFGIDKDSISTNTNEVSTMLNRLNVISSIYPLLTSHYKKILNKGVVARIYAKTYPFSKKDKLIIINSAHENRIISKKQKSNYQVIYNLYSLIKPLPIIKGIYYRLFIKNKFKNYEFWKREKVNDNIKQELIKKTARLGSQHKFSEQINLIFTQKN